MDYFTIEVFTIACRVNFKKASKINEKGADYLLLIKLARDVSVLNPKRIFDSSHVLLETTRNNWTFGFIQTARF